MIGSTRNAEDEILLQNLQEEAGRLGLACQVETEYTDCSLKGDTYSDATIDSDVLFVVNQPYQVLVDWMAKGHIGSVFIMY